MSERSPAPAKLPASKRVVAESVRLLRRLGSSRDPLPPRSAQEYATHLPLLLGLARLLRPRRILELGAGRYSTLAFLDQRAFPDRELLQSVENDREWLAEVKRLVGARDRCRLIATELSMDRWVGEADLSDFDLIFVDDSRTAVERSRTIRRVAARASERCTVVIHDFEIPSYQAASKSWPNRVLCAALNPSVGVAWHRAPLTKRAVSNLDTLISAHVHRLAADDVAGWLALFASKRVGSRR